MSRSIKCPLCGEEMDSDVTHAGCHNEKCFLGKDDVMYHKDMIRMLRRQLLKKNEELRQRLLVIREETVGCNCGEGQCGCAEYSLRHIEDFVDDALEMLK